MTVEFDASNPTGEEIDIPEREPTCDGSDDVIPIDEDTANHPPSIEANESDFGLLAWAVPPCEQVVLSAPAPDEDVTWDLQVPASPG